LKVRCQWLTLVILATQEAESRRILVRSQPRQIVCEKKKSPKVGSVGPEFKSTKKKRKENH
jgi:hypothetical protein